MSKELSKLKNELDKLSGLIVEKNVLQSPLDFWGRYDAWREAVKGLESAIRDLDDDISIILEEVKTGFNKEKVIDELKEEGCIIDNEAGNRAIEIVKKCGVK